MLYVLTGFTQDLGFRVFSFDGVSEDRSRDGYIVKTDLSLIRKYGIRLQDLPLLCRRLLENRDVTIDQHAFTYGEADMRLYANVVAVQAAASRKPQGPRPIPQNSGTEWRTPRR